MTIFMVVVTRIFILLWPFVVIILAAGYGACLDFSGKESEVEVP